MALPQLSFPDQMKNTKAECKINGAFLRLSRLLPQSNNHRLARPKAFLIDTTVAKRTNVIVSIVHLNQNSLLCFDAVMYREWRLGDRRQE